jgi:hypothetical protein
VRSLTLSTFVPVTLHLTRNASGNVRFSFREELFPSHLDGEEDPILLRARALVVGTQSVVTYEGEHSAFEPGATLGSVIHAEIPVEAPGDDVIVTFDWHSDACTGDCSPADVVIDDLRIE